MNDRELMQQALDALIDAADSQSWEMQQNIDQHGEWYRRSVYLKQATAKSQEAIEALRARLAQPEQEPVAWMYNGNLHIFDPSDWAEEPVRPLYTAPPQREWQGLTDEEIEKLVYDIRSQTTGVVATAYVARAIEAKLKEKNT